MTLKHLCWNKWAEQNKRCLWLYAVNGILFLILGPICIWYHLAGYDNYIGLSEIMEVNYNSRGQMALGFRCEISYLFVGLAVLAGIYIFSYLHSQKKIDFYHSQPLSEGKRFLCFYSSGILCCYIPYIICFLLNLFILKGYGGLTFDLFQQLLATGLLYMLVYFATYQIVVLVTILTGNVLYSVIIAGCAIVYERVFREIITDLCEYFFQHYLEYSFTEMIQCKWSVVWMFFQKAGKLDYFMSSKEMWEIMGTTCIRIAVLSILTGIVACFLYKKRPMEYQGPSIVFSGLKAVVKVSLTVIIVLYFLDIYCSGLLGCDRVKFFLGIAAIILIGVFVCHLIFEFLWELDYSTVRKHYKSAIVSGVSVFVLFCVFYFDCFGYDSYVPDENAVESVAVVMSNHYSECDEKRVLNKMQLNCVKEFCEVAKELSKKEMEQEVLKYKYEDYDWIHDKIQVADFAFHMKDGSTCYRTYHFVLKEEETPVSKLLQNEELIQELYPLIYNEKYVEEAKEFNVFWGDKGHDAADSMVIEGFKRTGQLQCLQEALKADFEENGQPSPYLSQEENASIGMLTLRDYSGKLSISESHYMIFPEYTRTIECLKEMGVKTDWVSELFKGCNS